MDTAFKIQMRRKGIYKHLLALVLTIKEFVEFLFSSAIVKIANTINNIAESNFTMTSHWKLILIYSTLCFPELLV